MPTLQTERGISRNSRVLNLDLADWFRNAETHRSKTVRNHCDLGAEPASRPRSRKVMFEFIDQPRAVLAELSLAGKQLCGIRAADRPVTKKKDVVSFAIEESRPLFTFAGIWTTFNGDRGTKSKPLRRPHQVYGFLTTSPNAIVEPIHPKSMPVILTTEEERDV
jgi:hypothetical protein